MLTRSLILGFSLAIFAAAQSDTRVADAAQQGDRAAVRSAIAEKADVNAAQGDGMTALHWAASSDDVEMAKILLQAGADVKARTRINRETPLFLACKNGSAGMVKALLEAGAEVNVADARQTTPLMVASAAGNTDAIALLLDHGAAVNAKEAAHGQTALMFAASLNRGPAIRLLIARGADASIASRVVKLGCGSAFGHDGCAAVDDNGDPLPDEAEAKGKDDAKSKEAAPGKAALDASAVAMGLKSAVYATDASAANESPEMKKLDGEVESLVKKVDAIEKRLPESKTAERNRARATVSGGMTPLLFAARDGQMDAARALIEAGADVNELSPADETSPLVMAVINGQFDLAKYLIDYGADPNRANDLGLTPLFETIDVQWAPKAWFPQPITSQEKVTYMDLMKALLDDGADVNAKLGKKLWFRAFGDHSWVDPAGATAFWRAAQSSDVEAMRFLVAHGADPNLPSAGGDTPLMVAAGIGWGANFSVNAPDSWISAVEYCVDLGADVNAVDAKGYTALHGAAYIGDNDVIKYLVDKGADVKAVAKDKNTVADMANGPTRFGIPHAETVKLLEALGSKNSHNCRSDQCLVAPKEEKKPTTEAASEAKPGGSR